MSLKQPKYLNQVGIGSSLYTEFGKDGFLCTSKMFLLLNFQQIKDLKAWEASSRNTSTKQQLFKQQLFEHVMAGWAEKEALEDLATYFTMPTLKIPSNISKQVSEIYAITIFNMFEEEFIESLWYYVSSLNNDG